MISFENDYSTGAHPRILEALTATNLEPAPGYGSDRFCEIAAARIRAACDNETADVFFLTGGTQTNTTVIAAVLVGTLVGVLNRAFGKRRDVIMGREAKRIQHTAGYQQKTGLQVEL